MPAAKIYPDTHFCAIGKIVEDQDHIVGEVIEHLPSGEVVVKLEGIDTPIAFAWMDLEPPCDLTASQLHH